MAQAGDDPIYKSYPTVLAEVLAAWVARIPDIQIAQGSIVEIWSEVFSSSAESFYLGLQLLHDDIFIQTMGALALQRRGSEIGRTQKSGFLASGEVTFTGSGGTFIATGSQVGAPRPALGDALVFETTDDATIPNPGVPTAPTAVDDAVSGNPTGTLEYGVTFVTAGGETALGAASSPVVVTSHKVALSAIPLGGTGTTARKIYRSKNGGAYQYVATLADNSTTTYLDNIADGSLGGNPPSESTAERVTVTAQATEVGTDYDVNTNAITSLVDVDGDVTAVTNAVPFTGGEDPEAIEAFRNAVLDWTQNPQSGSAKDLIAWALSIDGVESAAVFKNVNLAGSTELGSVVVRISGPGGVVPSGDVVDAVQSYLDDQDLANITIYVGTFTEQVESVTVFIAPLDDYTVEDLTSSVKGAIEDYVNGIPVGGTLYISGIISAVFRLPGIANVTVEDPVSDVTSDDSHKMVTDDAHIVVGLWS